MCYSSANATVDPHEALPPPDGFVPRSLSFAPLSVGWKHVLVDSRQLLLWDIFLSIPFWSVGKVDLGITWVGHPPLDKSRDFRPPLVSLITSAVLYALLLYPSSIT